MASDPVASKEEYLSLRQELYIIIQSRYNILTACIALVGVINGITFADKQSSELIVLLPVLLATILIPCLVITYYQTAHFSRISSYLHVRFEESSNQVMFQKLLGKIPGKI